MGRYADTYAAWVKDPHQFWADAAHQSGSQGLTGGACNACWNALI
tara:strand:- start:4975 stop:5109 length:135 start_codon:yes stop_codon:yes gene_type:complete